ncbi:MAG TPA: hypothetical protein VJB15_05990, partial [Rhodothermia bacterium]|nr:hypothetical protein [Rhodothermia bacterium]
MLRTIWRPVVIATAVGVAIVIWINRGPAQIISAESTVADRPEQPHPTSGPDRLSPFLASHESRAVDRPDADDVAPSFHIELQRLKTYVTEHPGDTNARL